jgi:hypothetical protein
MARFYCTMLLCGEYLRQRQADGTERSDLQKFASF